MTLIDTNTSPHANDIVHLTKREIECAKLLLQGLTAKEIAINLALSYRTVEDYIHTIKCKFRARNKTDLILKLIAHSL